MCSKSTFSCSVMLQEKYFSLSFKMEDINADGTRRPLLSKKVDSYGVRDTKSTKTTTENDFYKEQNETVFGWGYAIVLSNFFMMFFVFALMQSQSFFFVEWQEYFEASATEVSFLTSLSLLLLGLLSKSQFENLIVNYNREVSLYVLNKKRRIRMALYVHSKWAISVSLHVVTHTVSRDRKVKNLYVLHSTCRPASIRSVRIEMTDSKRPR